MQSRSSGTARRRAQFAARGLVAALLVLTAALLMASPASAHVIWTSPAPRADSLPTDTVGPCGNGKPAPAGTSPALYQPGAEIGVFFREDHGHTMNFSTARAYFTIEFSAAGAAGFTELKRVDVFSGQLPRLYGNVVVGGTGYVGVKLPTTPTDQGVLQLIYHTTDGTDDMYSCADIRIAAPPPAPPPPAPGSPAPPAPGVPPAPGPAPVVPVSLTPEQIAALLGDQLVPSGKTARIRTLRARGSFAGSLTAPEKGSVEIRWYQVPTGARLAKAAKPKPLLIARGNATLAAAGEKKTIRIKLTKAGKRLLRRAKRLKLTAQGIFRATGKTRVTATRSFTLRP